MFAAGDSTPAGLFASLPRLGGALLEILRTRVEIVGTELEEERERLRELLLYGFWALFFSAMSLAFASLFVVFALDGRARLHALAGFAALYLLLGLVALLQMRRSQRERAHLFAATVAELQKDCAALRCEP